MQKFVRRVVRPLVFSTLLSLSVLVGTTANAVTVLSGSEDLKDGVAPANGVTGFSIDRLLTTGFVSLWVNPKAFPGTTQASFFNSPFDAYVISFAPNANQPVFYEVLYTIGAQFTPSSAAYLDSFSPSSLSTNYLGDGDSPGAPGSPSKYQVIVPAGHSLAVVFFDNGQSSVASYIFSIDAFSDANRSENFGAVPLPAALPLFATGLGAFGLLGWWRKRKAV